MAKRRNIMPAIGHKNARKKRRELKKAMDSGIYNPFGVDTLTILRNSFTERPNLDSFVYKKKGK